MKAAPQHSLLFRLVAVVSRLQIRYLFQAGGRSRLLTGLFVLASAATAIGIITTMAWLLNLPLLFPPLGPSAFLLFATPLAETACPRNVVLGHVLGLVCGLAALAASGPLAAAAGGGFDWRHLAAMAGAMALASGAMVAFHCHHPPAAATALIAAMGAFTTPGQILGVLVAVVLLTASALVFNRLIGGLPYPLWRFDPSVLRAYGPLAGVPEDGSSPWASLTRQVFARRKR